MPNLFYVLDFIQVPPLIYIQFIEFRENEAAIMLLTYSLTRLTLYRAVLMPTECPSSTY